MLRRCRRRSKNVKNVGKILKKTFKRDFKNRSSSIDVKQRNFLNTALQYVLPVFAMLHCQTPIFWFK